MIKRKPISHNIIELFTKLSENLQKEPSILFTYIFGSFGKGKPGPLSDLDIAIFLDSSSELLEKKMDLIGKVTEIMGTDEVDLVLLNESPLSLRFEVLRTGRVLFSKDEAQRISFVARTYQSYCDFEPYRKFFWENTMMRLREGKFGS